MYSIQQLNLSALAQHLLPELVNKHGCGWLDGGCYTLAAAIHQVFPNTTHAGSFISGTGDIEHAVIKVKGLDLYGDGDGWHTFDEMRTKLLVKENVRCYRFLHAFSNLEMFDDIFDSIVGILNNSAQLTFDLPIECSGNLTISTGVYVGMGASVSSDFKEGCTHEYGAFIDGIESMVLAQYLAGVDVMSPAYCDGIKSVLEAGANSITGCPCAC